MMGDHGAPVWPLLAAFAVFVVLALAELVIPLTDEQPEEDGAKLGSDRILQNFALGILAMLGTSLFPIGIFAGAEAGAALGLGLFQIVHASWLVQLAAVLVVHSFAQYWLHRASHHWAFLWRFHTVHHSDATYDTSTALRNHPLELLLSLPLSLAVNLVLGIAPDVAMLAATLAYAAAFWQHAAIRLPRGVESALRTVMVTPALHRLHHATDRQLHDTNYGDYLAVWDRLFGTFKAAPEMPGPVGLPGQGPDHDRLLSLLLWPLGLLGRKQSLA